jgi:hypothetical protein
MTADRIVDLERRPTCGEAIEIALVNTMPDQALMATAAPAAIMQFLLVALSFGALTWAHLASDFSLANVVQETLMPGDRVFLMLNAANRDPETYEQPDRLHLARGGPAHLTFGFGMHICLGFPLARMEGQVALPAVARHWRNIALAVPEARLEWLNSMVFRGMTSLPLTVSR